MLSVGTHKKAIEFWILSCPLILQSYNRMTCLLLLLQLWVLDRVVEMLFFKITSNILSRSEWFGIYLVVCLDLIILYVFNCDLHLPYFYTSSLKFFLKSCISYLSLSDVLPVLEPYTHRLEMLLPLILK